MIESLTSCLRKINESYERIFRLQRGLENNSVLGVYAAALLSFAISFQSWFTIGIGLPASQRSLGQCPTYFQNCEILSRWPESFFLTFYIFVFHWLVAMAWALIRKKAGLAHASLLVLTLTSLFLAFALPHPREIPFLFFHLVPCVTLLFSRKTMVDLKWIWVTLYFASGLVKLHESWIAGTYFYALETGLPFFPDFAIPLLTHLVLFFELIGIWWVFSNTPRLRQTVYLFFIVFHIYSIALVGFRYPFYTLPLLVLLFDPAEPRREFPTRFATALGLIIIFFNIYPWLLRGDHKITFQGTEFAMNMFDANRQMRSEATILRAGSSSSIQSGSFEAFARPSPYSTWLSLRSSCLEPDVQSIRWTFDVAMNGARFFRIVDTPDLCQLTYLPFQNNEWIATNDIGLGYPSKNVYFERNKTKASAALPEPSATPQIRLNGLAEFLKNHVRSFQFFYFVVGFFSAIVCFRSLRRARFS